MTAPDRESPSRVARAAALAIANQAVASGANFGIGILLVRQLTQEGFGVWGLAFGQLLLALSVAESLFLTPMAIAIAQSPADRARGQAVTCFAGAVALGLALAPASGAVAAVVFRATSPGHLLAAAAIAAAAPCLVARDALLRVLYAMRREGGALVVNVAFAVSALALLRLPVSRATTTPIAVLEYGAAAAIATLVGLVVLRPFAGAHVSDPVGRMRPLLADGRWYLGGDLAGWLRNQAPAFAAASVLGVGALGLVNASRLLVSPPMMLNPALAQVALPRLSRVAAGSEAKTRLRRGVLLLAGVVLLADLAYFAVLATWFHRVTALLLGPHKTVPVALVAAWCAFALVQALRSAAEVSLKARRRPRHLLVANGIAGVAAFPLCVATSAWLGEQGVVLGSAAADLTVAVAIVLLGAWADQPSPPRDRGRRVLLRAGRRREPGAAQVADPDPGRPSAAP